MIEIVAYCLQLTPHHLASCRASCAQVSPIQAAKLDIYLCLQLGVQPRCVQVLCIAEIFGDSRADFLAHAAHDGDRQDLLVVRAVAARRTTSQLEVLKPIPWLWRSRTT